MKQEILLVKKMKNNNMSIKVDKVDLEGLILKEVKKNVEIHECYGVDYVDANKFLKLALYDMNREKVLKKRINILIGLIVFDAIIDVIVVFL